MFMYEIMYHIVKGISLHQLLGIMVEFTQNQCTGSEAAQFVIVNLELVGGTSAYPFDVTVTPSEQSPMSAEGNSIMCIIMCGLKNV